MTGYDVMRSTAGHREIEAATTTVDIMIPVYNEERALPGCVPPVGAVGLREATAAQAGAI
jgi:hypothetical protein